MVNGGRIATLVGNAMIQCHSCAADGKYMVLPSGELHIRDVAPEDGYKSYRCRTRHRVTRETRLSATDGRLVVTGELEHFLSSF